MSVRKPAQPLCVTPVGSLPCSIQCESTETLALLMILICDPEVLKEGLYIICWVILNVSEKDLSKHLIFLETYWLYLQRASCLCYRDGFHYWCRNFVPIFTCPTVLPSMLFPFPKPSEKMKTDLFFFCANCWKKLENQANGYREIIHLSQDFSLLALVGALKPHSYHP